jgi:hypothetical protein
VADDLRHTGIIPFPQRESAIDDPADHLRSVVCQRFSILHLITNHRHPEGSLPRTQVRARSRFSPSARPGEAEWVVAQGSH